MSVLALFIYKSKIEVYEYIDNEWLFNETYLCEHNDMVCNIESHKWIEYSKIHGYHIISDCRDECYTLWSLIADDCECDDCLQFIRKQHILMKTMNKSFNLEYYPQSSLTRVSYIKYSDICKTNEDQKP